MFQCIPITLWLVSYLLGLPDLCVMSHFLNALGILWSPSGLSFLLFLLPETIFPLFIGSTSFSGHRQFE